MIWILFIFGGFLFHENVAKSGNVQKSVKGTQSEKNYTRRTHVELRKSRRWAALISMFSCRLFLTCRDCVGQNEGELSLLGLESVAFLLCRAAVVIGSLSREPRPLPSVACGDENQIHTDSPILPNGALIRERAQRSSQIEGLVKRLFKVGFAQFESEK